MIELKQVLNEMAKKDYRDNNGTFSIVFMTCNRTTEEGGELIHLEEAYQCGLPPTCKGLEMRGVKCKQTGKPYAVHSRLIFMYNGQDVFWI